MNIQVTILWYILPMILSWLFGPKLITCLGYEDTWGNHVKKVHVLKGFLIGFIPILNASMVMACVIMYAIYLSEKLDKSDYWQTKLFKDKE